MYQIRNWVYFTGSAPTIFTIYVKVSWIVINMRWQQGGIYKAAAVLIRHFKSIIRPTEYLYPVNTSHVCLFENKSNSPMSMSQYRGPAYPALISQPLKCWCNASIITRTKSMHLTSYTTLNFKQLPYTDLELFKNRSYLHWKYHLCLNCLRIGHIYIGNIIYAFEIR